MTDGTPLIGRYAGIVCDLDGVVYLGPAAVDHAVDALNAQSVPIVYATNNASRTPADVAEHLLDLGVVTDAAHIVNSSMAGAHAVASRLGAGAPVLAVGGAGVAAALVAAGLRAVLPAEHARDDTPVEAVLQGYGASVTAADLGEAAYAIERGAIWVATNDDRTLPTNRGIAPGNGTLVSAVRTATGVDPVVVGKPQPPLYLIAAEILGFEPAALVGVGDRLDTDIAGAVAAGLDSVLVCTGVDGPREAALAPPAMRPTYLLRDLRGLSQPYAAPEPTPDGWICGTARVTVVGDRLVVADPAREPMTVARAALAAIWEQVDGGCDEGHAARLAGQMPVLD